MPTNITYRLDEDIPVDAWLALFRASGYNKKWKGERSARAALNYAWLVVTAWDGEKAVGTITVDSDGVNDAIIDDLLIHPDYREKGIGTALVRSALKHIEACGLDVQLYPIPGRESFFAKFGFVVQPKATVMDLIRDH